VASQQPQPHSPGVEEAQTDGDTGTTESQDEGTGEAESAEQSTEQPAAPIEPIETPESDPISEENKTDASDELQNTDASDELQNIEVRDLAAQERMAEAAEGAIVIAIAAAVITFAGVVLIGWTLHHTRRAADAAAKMVRESEKATAAVVADQRAWLSIEDVKLKHPTKFTEEGIIFGTLVTAKNYGRTPAKSVEIRLEGRFDQGNPEPFGVAQARFKDMLRKHPAEMGKLLFPQDTLIQGDRWADGIDKIGGAITTRPNGERKVAFTIFIGVSYRVMGDDSVHITYRPYSALNVLIGTEIPEGATVDLQEMPFLAGDAD
jgi:hypothetical protein